VGTEQDAAKIQAAVAGANLVDSGMIVGLGSGSTAAIMVDRLGRRVRDEKLSIVGVATSVATAEQARALGIPIRELDEIASIDLNLDGADEIDPAFRMIKGKGGALLREKLVVSAAKRRVTLITADKQVAQLGEKTAIPIEVSTTGLKHTERRLQALGAQTTIRHRKADPSALYLTDGGNAIIDCDFGPIPDPEDLDRRLQSLVGVFETGLFLGLCDHLIIGYADRVEERIRGI
jgi:ribose 5-phosphate isomerase A